MNEVTTGAPSAWRTLTRWYYEFLSYLVALSILALLVPVSLQIFSRYTPLVPTYIWTEEMARFMFIWMIMLGAMIGVREGRHFDIDIWPLLSARGHAALKLISAVFTLVFAIVFLWFGIEFTQFALNRISELAELPLWVIHVAWPLTGATWLIFLGEQMLDNVRIVFGRGR
jgi:TRAP-type transport system small permease protein